LNGLKGNMMEMGKTPFSGEQPRRRGEKNTYGRRSKRRMLQKKPSEQKIRTVTDASVPDGEAMIHGTKK